MITPNVYDVHGIDRPVYEAWGDVREVGNEL